jgi:hypothetical protein
MRTLLLMAGIGALTIPGVALAQSDCWRQQQDNQIAGAVVGAGVGAAVGGAVAGPGEHGAGAVIGAIGGGAVGNAAGGAATDCAAYISGGYYDAQGVWRQGPGYYDGAGQWIDTAPAPAALAAGDYNADVAYSGPAQDTAARESWIESRIHEGDSSGALSRGDSEHDFDQLAKVREFESQRRDAHAGLSEADRADVMNKLDNLTAIMRSQWGY